MNFEQLKDKYGVSITAPEAVVVAISERGPLSKQQLVKAVSVMCPHVKPETGRKAIERLKLRGNIKYDRGLFTLPSPAEMPDEKIQRRCVVDGRVTVFKQSSVSCVSSTFNKGVYEIMLNGGKTLHVESHNVPEGWMPESEVI